MRKTSDLPNNANCRETTQKIGHQKGKTNTTETGASWAMTKSVHQQAKNDNRLRNPEIEAKTDAKDFSEPETMDKVEHIQN